VHFSRVYLTDVKCNVIANKVNHESAKSVIELLSNTLIVKFSIVLASVTEQSKGVLLS
jgi:hypothetical protein